jgi:hypothetical protein
MDDFDERGRELRCPSCGLSFPSVLQQDMLQLKEDHLSPEEWELYR